MSKASQFRDQSIEELEAKIIDVRKEIYTIVNNQKLTKQKDKPHRLRLLKREIARILTVIRERQVLEA